MKKLLTFIFIALILGSCEDVVDVDLSETESKLVVDAVLRVDKEQQFINVRIGLRTSSIFFEENQPVQAENVTISYGQLNDEGTFDNLSTSSLVEETPGSGIYIPDPNLPTDQRIPTSAAELGTVFILEIDYEDKYYFAQTEYAPTVPIDNLEQGDEVFFDEEQTEVKVTFTDDGSTDNFYVFDFMFGEFQTVEDEFFQGQQFEFSFFYDEETQPGDEITVSILGATRGFYNYMDLVLEQTGNGGGPFQTPVATVRGNVFDITGSENVTVIDDVESPNDFALGYFAVVQEYRRSLIIE
ncbi:DUF4249 domain-containing protein [Muricauda oceani]|uniref:DUF4249 domain-containing protein n=1 Tax=Flagellimonas oceani TaxID=2698672 RepID=A0A6G7J2M1_9FLAO|nr:DUF4249 family protein [Allomuricauda oceani]MBW8241200.1 DUF4249 domain-containing protein [Allomuricauda oceani]QII44794.1 DUF4249 domain-containing protein [Allomuricauda oceani]